MKNKTKFIVALGVVFAALGCFVVSSMAGDKPYYKEITDTMLDENFAMESSIDTALSICLDVSTATADMVDCLNTAMEAWDKELNANYKKLMDAASAKEKEAIRDAQRKWMAYRDAEPQMYFVQEGSIWIVLGGNRRLEMIRTRAIELQNFYNIAYDL